jgi:hypothetical protein
MLCSISGEKERNTMSKFRVNNQPNLVEDLFPQPKQYSIDDVLGGILESFPVPDPEPFLIKLDNARNKAQTGQENDSSSLPGDPEEVRDLCCNVCGVAFPEDTARGKNPDKPECSQCGSSDVELIMEIGIVDAIPAYRYRVTLRPIGYGSVPDGYTLLRVSNEQWNYGAVAYAEPLTAAQMSRMDLIPEPEGFESLTTPALVEKLTNVPADNRTSISRDDCDFFAEVYRNVSLMQFIRREESTIYLDENGCRCFVSSGISKGGDWFTVRVKPGKTAQHRITSVNLPIRDTKAEAQFDLDGFARWKNWKVFK